MSDITLEIMRAYQAAILGETKVVSSAGVPDVEIRPRHPATCPWCKPGEDVRPRHPLTGNESSVQSSISTGQGVVLDAPHIARCTGDYMTEGCQGCFDRLQRQRQERSDMGVNRAREAAAFIYVHKVGQHGDEEQAVEALRRIILHSIRKSLADEGIIG